MDHYVIKPVGGKDELQQALNIRYKVFVEEQGISLEIERDEYDNSAYHVLAYMENKPVGTGRLLKGNNGMGRIGRMAVLASWRGLGIGGGILKGLIDEARRRGYREIYLHSQHDVIGFYRRFGFEHAGDELLEAGLVHLPMHKSLL